MSLKSLFGWLIIVLGGFVVFIICSALGYAMAVTFTVMSGWQIAAGILLGTLMVVIKLTEDKEGRSK